MRSLKLIEAVKIEDIVKLENLIANQEDIEQSDSYGWTALNWAAAKGSLDFVQKLLDLGANISNKGRDKRTPYKIALAATHIKCASVLLKAEQKAGLNNQSQSNPFCKAYPMDAVRKYPNWTATLENVENDAVVFLHPDLSVTGFIWHGENVLFDQVSPDSERFCREELGFSTPTEMELVAKFATQKTDDGDQSKS